MEFVFVSTIFVWLYLWRHLLSSILQILLGSPPWFGGILIDGLLSGALFVAGLIVFTAVYVTYRGIDVALGLPNQTELALIGMAGLVPAVLAGVTKLVGTITHVPYNSLTMTSYGADATLTSILPIVGLGLIVGVLTLVIVCQILVQESFNQVANADVAIILTTTVTGFALMSNAGGLTPVPDLGKLIGVVLFTVTLGVGLFVETYVSDERLRLLSYLPVLMVTVVIVISIVSEIGSITAGLFVFTHFMVLGVAAFTYERTNSLLGPTVAYTTLLLANTSIVFVFESGMQSW